MSAVRKSVKALVFAWAACAAILVVVEVALWLMPARALLSYNQQAYGFDNRLDYRTVNRVSALLDPPDIAIIGNSRPLRIIDVPLFKEQLAAHGMRVGDVRNYSCAGAIARTQYVLIRQLRESGKLPRLLIWGVSPNDFLHNPRSTVEENMTAFLSLAELAAGEPQLDLRRRVELLPRTLYASAERRIRTLTLRALVRIPSGPSGPAIGGTGAFHVKERADHAAHNDLCFVLTGEPENRVRWAMWDDELLAKPWLNQEEKQWGEEAVRLARAGGAEVIIVEVPVAPLMRNVYPPSLYRGFLLICKRAARRYGARFLSVKDIGAMMEDRDYKDFGHANWLGVEKFTTALAWALRGDPRVAGLATSSTGMLEPLVPTRKSTVQPATAKAAAEPG